MTSKLIMRRILYASLILFLIAAVPLLVVIPRVVARRSAGTYAGSVLPLPLVSADTPLIGWLAPLLQQWMGSTGGLSVFVSSSPNATGAATIFALHGQAQRIYCLVHNSAIPPVPVHALLLFQWSQGSPPPVFSFSTTKVAGQLSYTYFTVSMPGHYRCDVSTNSHPVGSAQFTVTL